MGDGTGMMVATHNKQSIAYVVGRLRHLKCAHTVPALLVAVEAPRSAVQVPRMVRDERYRTREAIEASRFGKLFAAVCCASPSHGC